MNTLRFRAERDDYGNIELFVDAAAHGFSGRSSAWLSADRLAAFAASIEAFPIPAEGSQVLEGGFWSQHDRSLEETHVQVRVVPIDRRGTLGVQVRLETDSWPGDRPESIHRVSLEIPTDYVSLQRFARQIRDMLVGRRPEAVLGSIDP